MSSDPVLNAIRGEWGGDNILAVCRFGSSASSAAPSRYSDHDLAVIVEGTPAVAERDAASRAIKKKLRLAGDLGLYGFNFFPRAAFEAMVARRSWLAASIARAYQPLFDPEALFERLPRMPEAVPFGWRDVEAPPDTAYRRLIALHESAATLLAGDKEVANWYRSEVFRVQLLQRCRNAGLYLSRASILDAAQALERTLRLRVDQAEVHRLNYLQYTAGEYLWSHPSQDRRHLKIAARLRDAGSMLLALRHAYNAARLAYLRRLHAMRYFILDGEVSHAFLLHHDVSGKIESSSLLAEQILGRLGVASFDVDTNGDGIYEQLAPSYPAEVYSRLVDDLAAIVDAVEQLPPVATPSQPVASLIVPTHRGAASLARTLAAVDRLIVPEEQMEVIVVHDGEPAPAAHRLRFPTSTLGKPHTGVGSSRAFGVERAGGDYLLFLDDDVVPSPTWALRLLQAAESGTAAFIGSTILSIPPASLIERYCDDRELLRTPVAGADGAIANVITASASLRREALERIAATAQLPIRREVVGGDNVDLTWTIIAAGLGVAHAEKAVTFHQHRASLFALMRQHAGYGHGTIVHCRERRRNPADLLIAGESVGSVVADTLRYAVREVPKRLRKAARERRLEPLLYPFIDLARRGAYNAGILLALRESTRRHE
jgi:GT2 family glycosyltransferase